MKRITRVVLIALICICASLSAGNGLVKTTACLGALGGLQAGGTRMWKNYCDILIINKKLATIKKAQETALGNHTLYGLSCIQPLLEPARAAFSYIAPWVNSTVAKAVDTGLKVAKNVDPEELARERKTLIQQQWIIGGCSILGICALAHLLK